MATPSPLRRPLPGRLLGGLLVLVFAVTATGWLSTDLAAQGKKEEEEDKAPAKKKPPEVEDEVPPAKSKKRPPEVEDEGPAKPRKVVKPEDDEPKGGKPRPKPKTGTPVEAQTSLVEALRETKNRDLRDLYTGLKVPHDRITVRSIGDETSVRAIEPLTRYYAGEQTRFKNGFIQVWTYDEEWRKSKNSTPYAHALSIEPYEEIALKQVDEFLKKGLESLPETNPRRVSRADQLKAAETVLASVDRYHTSARETGDRKGEEWDPIRQRLRERLFQIQLERLETFAKAGDVGDWEGATAYARTLADAYREPKERTPIAAALVRMIDAQLRANPGDGQMREARERLRLLEEILPNNEASGPIVASLRKQAEALLAEAKRLREAREYDKAREKMELARDISGNLPGLGEELASLETNHPVLRVGVRDLPKLFFPPEATTDGDRRAVELLFEGLVKLQVQPGVGQRYEAGLSAGLPRLLPLGREFRIARGAAWSDGTPVTVGDVKETLRSMRDPKRWPGFSPMWNGMIQDAEGGGDSFRFTMRLSQGYLDPLSLMTFKVMPQTTLRQAERPEAKRIGSGPFQYVKSIGSLNRTAAQFVANPGYAGREGKLGLPRVREIHLVHFAEGDDPTALLIEGKLDMLLDLSAGKAEELRKQENARGNVVVRGPMANRRVYFLAVNHREAPFNGNAALPRALAQAINRQKLLDDHFRQGTKAHHSLNGPFPAGSWPCDPKVPAELYDADQAKTQARKALKEANSGPISLSVKYPSGDPAIRAAVEDLCKSVSEVLRLDDKTYIELKPEPKDPHVLREEVEHKHNYQLAYYHYDHPSEAFWVAPLFDLNATAIDGSNYLGYIDGELQSVFEQAKNHRDFKDVRETMHLVHRMLEQRMPLIPLWQLDTFLAHRPVLKLTPNVDPLLIFNDVENWKVEK